MLRITRPTGVEGLPSTSTLSWDAQHQHPQQEMIPPASMSLAPSPGTRSWHHSPARQTDTALPGASRAWLSSSPGDAEDTEVR